MEPKSDELEITRYPKRRDRSGSDIDSDINMSTTSSGNPKRHKQDYENNSEFELPDCARTSVTLSWHNYAVGWICALPLELAAAKSMLDAVHDNLDQNVHDSNTYTLGNIGPHNIVLACLPYKGTGTNHAAIVANNLRRSFSSINLVLMVGIGGGIPGPHDPRLGDVVVGSEVIQYDLGKTIKEGRFQRTGILRRSHENVRTALSKFKAEHDAHENEIPTILRQMVERHPTMAQYATPGSPPDLLFLPDCEHSSITNCESCDTLKLVPRPSRFDKKPRIHYGKIASGNHVVKDAVERDTLAQELNVLCIEMEAAGVMDCYPCLSIRGLSDYSDAHKNDGWKRYAAGTAAACAKEFLSIVPSRRVLSESAAPTPSSIVYVIKLMNFTNTDVETVPISNSSQSSCHGQHNSTSGKQSGQEVIVCNIEAGDNARQIVSSDGDGNIIAKNIKARNNAWQVFGPPELMRHLANFRQAQNTEVTDDESTTQFIDECASGTARR
ncbi:unnamed protein product [Clonostachys chloroleuca]|uniref:Nucleoside phosphorylase domain-containing protein n=1 Tax=Clonostachys chloroleuca TaxID=1926264 RepID=A0AA35PYG7_9HYPO|nr:unnamed protein product [Clonostachys chloroleuca]